MENISYEFPLVKYIVIENSDNKLYKGLFTYAPENSLSSILFYL